MWPRQVHSRVANAGIIVLKYENRNTALLLLLLVTVVFTKKHHCARVLKDKSFKSFLEFWLFSPHFTYSFLSPTLGITFNQSDHLSFFFIFFPKPSPFFIRDEEEKIILGPVLQNFLRLLFSIIRSIINDSFIFANHFHPCLIFAGIATSLTWWCSLIRHI